MQATANHWSPDTQRFYYQDYLTGDSREAQKHAVEKDHDETTNVHLHLHPQ
jgi:hypothetical protein